MDKDTIYNLASGGLALAGVLFGVWAKRKSDRRTGEIDEMRTLLAGYKDLYDLNSREIQHLKSEVDELRKTVETLKKTEHACQTELHKVRMEHLRLKEEHDVIREKLNIKDV